MNSLPSLRRRSSAAAAGARPAVLVLVLASRLLLAPGSFGQCPPVFEGKSFAPASSAGGFVGDDVAIEGARAIVGSPNVPSLPAGQGAVEVFERTGADGVDFAGLNAGAAFVFEEAGAGYVETGPLFATDRQVTDNFGEGRLVATSVRDDSGALDGGWIYVFDRVRVRLRLRRGSAGVRREAPRVRRRSLRGRGLVGRGRRRSDPRRRAARLSSSS